MSTSWQGAQLTSWVDQWAATYTVDADQILDRYAGASQLDRTNLEELVAWKFSSDARRRKRTLNLLDQATDQAIQSYTRRAIGCNDELAALLLVQWIPGVGPALGSAILMAALPAQYSVFDVRSLASARALGCCPPGPTRATNDAWEPYLAAVRRIASHTDRPIRHVDRALFRANGRLNLP